MKTFRVLVDYHMSLVYDLGELTSEEFKSFLMKNNVGYMYFQIENNVYSGKHNEQLNQELTEIIVNHPQERYFFDSDIHTWANDLIFAEKVYIYANTFESPFYADIAPLTFLIDKDDRIVIPGFQEEHLKRQWCLEQCWQQEPLEINIDLLKDENYDTLRCTEITIDLLSWCNECGTIIQIIKKNDRYLIINGFSIYLNQLRKNSKTIMVQKIDV